MRSASSVGWRSVASSFRQRSRNRVWECPSSLDNSDEVSFSWSCKVRAFLSQITDEKKEECE
jgi:hypothetical protein